MVTIKVPEGHAKDLVRGTLLLGKHDIQLSDLKELDVDAEVVRRALERAKSLTAGVPLIATKNDVKNPQGTKGPLTKLMLECFGALPPESVGRLLDLALKRLPALEGCGEEYIPKIALMKAGTDQPEGDALTLVLTYAGFSWYLGKMRFSLRDFRMFLFVPVRLYEDPMNFLQYARVQGERLLPDFVTYDWALRLWIAVNFNVAGVFKVYFVRKITNTVDVLEYMTIDTTAEREAIAKVFDKPLSEVKTHLNAVLRNVMDYSPDQLAVRFANALYQVAHGLTPAYELKILGLRDYATLLTTKSEIPYLIRDIAKTALAVRL